MTRFIPRLGRALRRGARCEDGSATIEFVILFPAIVLILLSSIELGTLMVRQVMLDRALDLTVRDLRLGTFDEEFAGFASTLESAAAAQEAHNLIRTQVCERALFIPNCATAAGGAEAELKIEMVLGDARAWRPLSATPDCVDRANPGTPALEFTVGDQNRLMLLRACALFDPFFPQSGLGFAWTEAAGGHYALTSTSAFVIEPNRERT